ncbi:MAG: tRNA pseudouridine(54/55) synthase Pus10 [Thermoplasmataceae archaeon]
MQGKTFPKICLRCLGRAFAMKGSGLTNIERGQSALDSPELHQFVENVSSESNCIICNGIFERLKLYSGEMKRLSSNYEFSTFLVGSRFPEDKINLEREIQSSFAGSEGESIRKEFNRELGKVFELDSEKNANFKNPEITFIIDTNFDSIKLEVRSIFIYGVYLKMRRDIPQTRWIKYSEINDSVESIIGERALVLTKGKEYFLHGAGREDVDVRMLGNGREFVLEVTDPMIRSIDLQLFEDSVNKSEKGVMISGLIIVERKKVSEVKDERHDKTYIAKIAPEDSILDEKILADSLSSIRGKLIYQRTPLRVTESRSDAIRERRILDAKLLSVDGNIATVEITAEAGTYIKELVNGDLGRTKGSLTEIYGKSLKVIELDVVKIHRGA